MNMELQSTQNLEEICDYLELCVEEAKNKAWGDGISFALCFIKKLLPSAQPEQSIAQERYEDLCEYFKDCSDQGRSILNDRKEFKSWLDRMKWHVMECNKLGRELEKLKTAQPEQQWIPVTERLPEDGQNVLVTYKTTDKIHPCQYHDDGSRNPWYSYIDQCRAHMNVVLAWMPLPEPYREEGGQA